MTIREALEREGIMDVIQSMACMRGLHCDNLDDNTLRALVIEEAEFTLDATRREDAEEYAEAVAYSNRLKALLGEVK